MYSKFAVFVVGVLLALLYLPVSAVIHAINGDYVIALIYVGVSVVASILLRYILTRILSVSSTWISVRLSSTDVCPQEHKPPLECFVILFVFLCNTVTSSYTLFHVGPPDFWWILSMSIISHLLVSLSAPAEFILMCGYAVLGYHSYDIRGHVVFTEKTMEQLLSEDSLTVVQCSYGVFLEKESYDY